MDPLSLLVALVVTSLSLVGLLGLIIIVSAARGAGDELGRAAIAESAPWIARIIPTLVVRLIFLRADSRVRDDLIREVASLVDAEFDQRTATSERVRGIFRLLAQAASLATEGFRMRLQSLQADQSRAEDTGAGISEEELAQRVAHMRRILEDFQQSIPEWPTFQLPQLPVIKVPELPNIPAVELPSIQLPEMPPLDELDAAAAKLRRVAERFRP